MKRRGAVFSKSAWGLGSGLRLTLLTAVLFIAGCGTIQKWTDTTPPPEMVTFAEYGTVTQVTSAAMAGKEARQGDIALTVDLDDGEVVVIIQTEDNVYVPGDRVRVVRDAENKFVRAQVF